MTDSSVKLVFRIRSSHLCIVTRTSCHSPLMNTIDEPAEYLFESKFFSHFRSHTYTIFNLTSTLILEYFKVKVLDII